MSLELDMEVGAEIRNEFLVARINGAPVALVPDLIAVLDRESGNRRDAGLWSKGEGSGLCGDPMLRTHEVLAVLAPRMFGVEEDLMPIEDLSGVS